MAQGRANLTLDGGTTAYERKDTIRERHASDSARQREGNWQLLDGTRVQDRDSTWNLRVLLKLKCGGTGVIGRRGTTLPSIHTTISVSCYSAF